MTTNLYDLHVKLTQQPCSCTSTQRGSQWDIHHKNH